MKGWEGEGTMTDFLTGYLIGLAVLTLAGNLLCYQLWELSSVPGLNQLWRRNTCVWVCFLVCVGGCVFVWVWGGVSATREYKLFGIH